MTKTKKEYLTPQLTVVQFKVERGYAASNVNVALGNLADAANHFIEERQYESDMWDDSRYGTANIQNRTGGNSTNSLSNDGGWAANDNGGYF